MSLKGKVIVITGATSGIGKALALEAARRGASVVVSGRNEERLEEVRAQIASGGTPVHAIRADVSKEEEARRLIELSAQHMGGIDILINNAGISMRALFRDVDLEVIRQVMDINFWGAVYCTKYALDHVLKRKGSVVGISSIAGFKGLPARTGYSASKFALHGFLESVRIENAAKGLHVLLACPGFTASNIRNTALAADGSQQGESPRDEQKMMTAEEVAGHILDAIENRKRTIVLTREGRLTVLLSKFFPAWLDRLVLKHFAKEKNNPV
ncbi:MAG: SDR family oxidoreductase [Flavobacteriales bacterium]|nr:SDR family oxidoreductase [Flavobacteriales bacterium]